MEQGRVDSRSKNRVSRGNSHVVKKEFVAKFKGEIRHYIKPVQQSSELEDMDVDVPTSKIPRKRRRSKDQANTEEDSDKDYNYSDEESYEESD